MRSEHWFVRWRPSRALRQHIDDFASKSSATHSVRAELWPPSESRVPALCGVRVGDMESFKAAALGELRAGGCDVDGLPCHRHSRRSPRSDRAGRIRGATRRPGSRRSSTRSAASGASAQPAGPSMNAATSNGSADRPPSEDASGTTTAARVVTGKAARSASAPTCARGTRRFSAKRANNGSGSARSRHCTTLRESASPPSPAQRNRGRGGDEMKMTRLAVMFDTAFTGTSAPNAPCRQRRDPGIQIMVATAARARSSSLDEIR